MHPDRVLHAPVPLIYRIPRFIRGIDRIFVLVYRGNLDS